MNHKPLFAERLRALREQMSKEGLDACLLPTSDAFQSEYLPPQSRQVEWLCGFSGENGAIVVTHESAAIFVDGRFMVQITRQAPADLFQYCHIHNHPPAQWLGQNLAAGSKVGIGGYLHSAGDVEQHRKILAEHGIELIDVTDNLVNRIWLDRPAPGQHPIILLSTSGQASLDKRLKMAQILEERHCNALLITHPECVCWLLNIRGRDIPCTPVVMSYALLHQDGSVDLFVDTDKLVDGFHEHVGDGVNVHPLDHIETALAALAGQTVHIDPDETPARLYAQLASSEALLRQYKDPCLLAKARKNPTEIAGFRRAHIRDGIAMCQFLAWLDAQVTAGTTHDEGTLAEKIEALRSEQPLYIEPSFATISSLGPNAALCHYDHRYHTPRAMGSDGIYLLDSGGHYFDGTTDVTRTIQVGAVSDWCKQMYTLVLKGHIALATCRFPANTTGLQLDMCARLPLWQQGYDYDHGTGHGVGHCLGVHELPPLFSNRFDSEPLEAGMVVTIEPGYYRADQWGVRHENQYEVVPVAGDNEVETLAFRPLTLVPFDTRLLDRSLLSTAEIDWLNHYHEQVVEQIGPALDLAEQLWLAEACKAV